MMKKLLFLFFAISMALSACGTASSQPTPPAQTGTPTATATATQTPTAAITPLPTIPTFTPTFDASTIVTVTPAEKSICPKVNYAIPFENGFKKIDTCFKTAEQDGSYPVACLNKNLHYEILDYLNSGGDIKTILATLDEYNYGENYLYVYKDLTGDTEPEFLLRDTFRYSSSGGYFFYTCIDGYYEIKREASQDTGVAIYSIRDINLNGIPEVVFEIQNVLVVIEWDGNLFTEILGIRDFGASRYDIQDVNDDGLLEITLSRGYPPFGDEQEEFPWRHYTSTYAWNGASYILKSKEFEYPEYRFQAIQDADVYASSGLNDKAYLYYQDAVSNVNLEWWSQERREFLTSYLHIPNTPTPPPSLQPDPAEYPSLAAYAYYRIMLLHLVQGQEAEAASTYQTLRDTFGTDQYATPYVEMATAFWESYQSAHKMYDGCAAAIQYAVEHPEILIPLGSDYHGAQSHIYEPADVCPFR
ncbi:MAG: hypothetical protein Q8L87_00070 [Anaerolineales bacterium]|nr:hypothetical protein [Anaerolineales bacterium]